MEEDRVLTTEQVAERLQVTHVTVQEWLRAGKLRGMKLGTNRLGWRIRPSDLDAFMESRMHLPGAAATSSPSLKSDTED